VAHLAVWVSIKAAPEQVWDVITDLERQSEWMVDVRSLEVTSAQKQGAGAVMRVRSELFGLPIVRDVMEVTAWEPPVRMAVAHRGQFAGTGEFRLEAAEGGTRFSWTEVVRPPMGVLGEALFALLVRPHLSRVFRRSLANVRRLAEARAGVTREG
jgi:carbon monoxide dehydrogenase subunit G